MVPAGRREDAAGNVCRCSLLEELLDEKRPKRKHRGAAKRESYAQRQGTERAVWEEGAFWLN